MSWTRRRSLGAVAACGLALAGAALVPVGPASAEPAQSLPDADLFCASSPTPVDAFVARPPAASFWIDDPTYGGHYAILDQIHYLADGVLLYHPVADPSTLPVVGPLKVFGQKESGQPTLSCQVVSRFSRPTGDFTIIAPVTLVRVSD